MRRELTGPQSLDFRTEHKVRSHLLQGSSDSTPHLLGLDILWVFPVHVLSSLWLDVLPIYRNVSSLPPPTPCMHSLVSPREEVTAPEPRKC